MLLAFIGELTSALQTNYLFAQRDRGVPHARIGAILGRTALSCRLRVHHINKRNRNTSDQVLRERQFRSAIDRTPPRRRNGQPSAAPSRSRQRRLVPRTPRGQHLPLASREDVEQAAAALHGISLGESQVNVSQAHSPKTLISVMPSIWPSLQSGLPRSLYMIHACIQWFDHWPTRNQLTVTARRSSTRTQQCLVGSFYSHQTALRQDSQAT